jgi:hypothetical protein
VSWESALDSFSNQKEATDFAQDVVKEQKSEQFQQHTDRNCDVRKNVK